MSLEKALQLEPKRRKALEELVVAYHYAEKDDQAKIFYEKLRSIDPVSADNLYQRIIRPMEQQP